MKFSRYFYKLQLGLISNYDDGHVQYMMQSLITTLLLFVIYLNI